MSPKDADGMANSVDPEQTAPRGGADPDQSAPLETVWYGSSLPSYIHLKTEDHYGTLNSQNTVGRNWPSFESPVSFIYLRFYSAYILI